MTSQTFCYYCVEFVKLDTCAKFHDHQSNNNKVMIGGGGSSIGGDGTAHFYNSKTFLDGFFTTSISEQFFI